VAKKNEKKLSKQKKNVRKKNTASTLKRERPPVRSIFSEAVSVLFLSMAVFVFFSLLSQEFSQSGLLYSGYALEYESFRNLMGPVGHITATILSGFFGICSMVLVVWLAWLSWHFWRRHDQAHESRELGLGGNLLALFCVGTGLLGMLAASCAFGAAIGGARVGGQLGIFLAEPLLVLFHTIGAVLITGAALLLFMAIATGKSLGVLVRDLIEQALWLFAQIFSFSASFLGTSVRLLGAAVSTSYSYWKNFLLMRREQKEQRLFDHEESAARAEKRSRRKIRVAKRR